MNEALLVLGMLSALVSAILMILDVFPLPARIAMLLVGIGLIATSRIAGASYISGPTIPIEGGLAVR